MLAAAVVLVAGCSDSKAEETASAPDADVSATADDIVTGTATRTHHGDTTVFASRSTFDARVSVPDAALGADLESDDISAHVLALESTEDDASAIAFVLGPDGAEFSEPVLLEWDGPWAPDFDFTLSATTGDGEPIADEQSPTSNSIVALRVEPTSETTAHYTLPIDHFSVWSVYMSTTLFGVDVEFTASAEKPEAVVVNQPTTVDVILTGETIIGAEACGNGVIGSVDGPLRASFASKVAECAYTLGRKVTVHRPLAIECSSVGTGRVNATLYGLVLFNFQELDATRVKQMRALMLRKSYDLVQTPGGAKVQISDSAKGNFGGMFAASLSLSVTCVATAPATTTTVASSTSVPRPTTSSLPDTTTTTTSAPPATTTPSTPPVTSAPTTTTTTAPSPPTTWGVEGDWAFNDYDTCDWNGSGGCGWYFGSTHGEYLMGPIGCPGVRLAGDVREVSRMTGC